MNLLPETVIDKIISASNHRIAHRCPDKKRINIASINGANTLSTEIGISCAKPEAKKRPDICGLCDLASEDGQSWQVIYRFENDKKPAFDRKIVIEQ